MRRKLTSGLCLLTLTLFSYTAQAQYVWIDAQGRKQFSDTPPPPSVKQKNILKSAQLPESGSADSNAAAGNAAAPDAPKVPDLQSRNEDFNKRRAEQAEKDRKAAEAQQQAATKAKNCDRLRSYAQALNSGARIGNNDANGERSFLSDEQRQKELSDATRGLQDCTK